MINYLKPLKEEGFILAHGFSSFCPYSLAPLILGPLESEHYVGRNMWQRLLTSRQAGSRERKCLCYLIFFFYSFLFHPGPQPTEWQGRSFPLY
jgi:hypothetical protein